MILVKRYQLGLFIGLTFGDGHASVSSYTYTCIHTTTCIHTAR
jgi:hypothetical protein